MSHPNPYPHCVFCGAKADSREHAIPKWMSKRLGIKDMMGNASHGLVPRRHPVSFASHRARIFCGACNTHFKHLEDRVIPLLTPMAQGRVVVLGRDSQTLLALWAAKTAIALLSERAELRELVPKPHRDAVRYDGVPHAHCWVGYIPWDGPPSVFAADNAVDLPGIEPSTGRKAYTVIFGFKGAAFQVAGIEPIPDGYRIGVTGYSVQQFWPSTGMGLLSWPFRACATRKDIPLMAQFGPLLRE